VIAPRLDDTAMFCQELDECCIGALWRQSPLEHRCDLEFEDLNKIWHLVRFEFELDWEAALEPGVQVEEVVFEVALLTFNVITRVPCIIVAAGKIQERW
jgi:hypothetical protein